MAQEYLGYLTGDIATKSMDLYGRIEISVGCSARTIYWVEAR